MLSASISVSDIRSKPKYARVRTFFAEKFGHVIKKPYLCAAFLAVDWFDTRLSHAECAEKANMFNPLKGI